ncbi:MAG: peptide ABC transporter substrate-binding protein [Candidatus Eremiobacteraeota bacterium]|nr:peptide ABC transporter substrate-binding protein [Candidatus Eremiobacteraeota bacterium]
MGQRKWGLPWLLVALALTAMTAVACTRVESGGATAGARHSWTIPDTLRVALPGSPNTLNPILSTQQTETVIETFAFDPLIATDPDGKDVPVLAAIVPTLENGGISKDGLTITYHLRRGVVWHDGAPFTSRDVKFTFDAIMNPNTAVTTRHGYDVVNRVETPDAYTVVFRLKRPFAPAVHTFFAHSDAPYMILPAHLLSEYHDLNRIPFNGAPIGTGPFKFVRWLRGDRIEYERNDRYFLGRPKLRSVVIHFIADENTIVNEMRAHELDWFFQATPRSYAQLRGVPGVINHLVPFNGVDYIIFNTRRPPFDDPRMRRAVGSALDKRRIVDDITFGTAIPATEDIPSFMWAYDPTAGTSARNLPQAKALFDAAGWRVGPDGIRTRNGNRLAMQLAYRIESVTDRGRGVLIAQMLREAGIDVQLKGYTTALLYGPVGTGILASGRYQAGLLTWYAGVDPDDSSQLICSEQPPHGYDWARYCNPAMDAAQHIALTHYDRPARKRAYSVIQHLLAQDAPLVYLWWPRQIESVSEDLRGFRPNGIVESWNSWQWSI